MKMLKMMNNAIATVAVLTFLVSLTFVASSNGSNEVAAEVCTYSLIASFVSLIFVSPKWSNTSSLA